MLNFMKIIFVVGFLCLAGCGSATSKEELPATTGKVDLNAYQGTWYEIARLPMFFQRNCAQSEAAYKLLTNGSMDIINRCQNIEGKWSYAHAVATAEEIGSTDKLLVRFDNWVNDISGGAITSDYWILYVDKNYKEAIVGTPNRDYLWILSRTPEISDSRRDALVNKVRDQGYDTQKLIWRVPNVQMDAIQSK